MKNVREKLREKLAFSSDILNPIIGALTRKMIRTGVSEGIMSAAGNQMASSELPSSTIIYVPTPVPESNAPDAPTVIRNIPISVSLKTPEHGGTPVINATPIIPAEGVQIEDVSQSRKQMA